MGAFPPGIVRSLEVVVGEEAFVSEEEATRQSGYSSSNRAMTRNNVSSKKSNFPGDSVSILP